MKTIVKRKKGLRRTTQALALKNIVCQLQHMNNKTFPTEHSCTMKNQGYLECEISVLATQNLPENLSWDGRENQEDGRHYL